VIFGDSSFFVGLADTRDQWHRRALRLERSLLKGFVVSDLVVAESVTIIGSRGGGQAASELYEFFRDSCEIEFVDEGLLAQAMALVLRFDGKLSVADGASVAIMGRREIPRIVSFDSDFDRIKGIERIS
jgi:predicted nucleic acid-binding protein